MQTLCTISLVRHGRVYNPLELFYGRLPRFHLSASGREEAFRVARFFKKGTICAVFSSPLLRAVQTARAIVDHHSSRNLKISRLLSEVHTPWDGKPAREVDRLDGDVYTGSAPGFEQPGDVAERAQRFFRKACRTYSEGHVVAVTHGDVIAMTVLWARGAEPSAEKKAALNPFGIADGYPATGSVTTFIFRGKSLYNPTIRYSRPSLLFPA